MQVRRISGLCLVASLLAVLPACVIHSGGETFAFGGDDYKAERQETFALELAAGETLDVELPYGDILVRVANGEAPHVAAHWHAGGDDQAMAEAVLARYKLELTRGQAQLSVRAVGEPVAAKGTFSMKRYGASVDLVLVVPPSPSFFHLSLSVAFFHENY